MSASESISKSKEEPVGSPSPSLGGKVRSKSKRKAKRQLARSESEATVARLRDASGRVKSARVRELAHEHNRTKKQNRNLR